MTTVASPLSLVEALQQADQALENYEARRALELLQPFEGDTSLDYLACLIEALYIDRQFALAETTIEQALRRYPGEARLLHASALNVFHQRNYTEAEARLKATIAAHPGYGTAYNNLGMNYEFMNRIEDARAAYLQAIRRAPELAPGYKNLGRLAEAEGKLDEARKFFEQGREHTPAKAEFEDLIVNLGHNFRPVAEVEPRSDSHEYTLALEISEAALRHLDPLKKPAMIDLICGEGVVGKKLWERVGTITGIDPRHHELVKARAANVYHDLKDQYPSAFLRTCKRGETDLITANGAFLDTGDLLPVFLNIHAVLAPGGLLVMAFQTRPDSIGYVIEENGSISHDPGYVQGRADFEGMRLLERRDFDASNHPDLKRAYTLMVFAKPA